jgi:alanine racemase
VKPPYRCWAEVDLDALRENVAWIRHRVGTGVRILAVVKADAYGHGLKQIAALLMQSGVDLFGVANLQEAQAIRTVGPGWPILMLGACLPDEVELAVRDDVMPTLSSPDEIARFSRAAKRFGKTVPVHVKIDTGMGRLGASPGDAPELIRRIRRTQGLQVQGVYTHFAAAEDDAAFSRRQANRFRRVLHQLAADAVPIPLSHANNSAALLHEPDTLFNLVRPGLLIYGIIPPGRRRAATGLRHRVRPALSWRCRVSLIKEVRAGTPLSYGGTFVTRRRTRVATLTAGYGDGYLRAGSNRAEVLIGGRRCRLLGRITMDQMLVALPRSLPVQPGDEAVLIGRQGAHEITAGELAAWADTVPWEVLTNITYRVPRLYRGGQAA